MKDSLGPITGFDIFIDKDALSLSMSGSISDVTRIPYEFHTSEDQPIFSPIFSISYLTIEIQTYVHEIIKSFQYFIESVLIKSQNQQFFFVIGGVIFLLKKDRSNQYQYSLYKDINSKVKADPVDIADTLRLLESNSVINKLLSQNPNHKTSMYN